MKPATVAIVAVLLLARASGPIPVLDVAELIAAADLVVAGRAEAPVSIGSTSVTFEAGGRVSARQMRTGITVGEAFKGEPDGQVLVDFLIPDTPMGYKFPVPSEYRVFFLRRAGISDRYVFASPYHPSVIALPGQTTAGGPALEHVADAVARVLDSPGAARNARLDAIGVLRFTRTPAAERALRSVIADRDRVLQLTAVAALLEANDPAAFDVAEEALLRGESTVPPHLRWNLLAAIELKLKAPEAVPLLSRLMTSPDPRARRAASRALSQTGSSTAVGPLAAALYDADKEVRFNAVIGLAVYTGQSEWRPGFDGFEFDEQRFLDYWRAWARGR